MKLFLFFFFVSFLFLLLQTTALHLLPLGPVVPDLALVLSVYWALNRPAVSTVLGSFSLGYAVDVFSSPILGINAFAMSLVFLAAYLGSRHIWIRSPLYTFVIVFFASWVKVSAMAILWVIFLSSKEIWTSLLKYVFLDALSAAILAPVLFYLLNWGEGRLKRVRTAP